MNDILVATGIGIFLLALAIWIEIRERGVVPGGRQLAEFRAAADLNRSAVCRVRVDSSGIPEPMRGFAQRQSEPFCSDLPSLQAHTSPAE